MPVAAINEDCQVGSSEDYIRAKPEPRDSNVDTIAQPKTMEFTPQRQFCGHIALSGVTEAGRRCGGWGKSDVLTHWMTT
jgi:hypothetical protein